MKKKYETEQYHIQSPKKKEARSPAIETNHDPWPT